jgi:hypothetical protein
MTEIVSLDYTHRALNRNQQDLLSPQCTVFG